MNRTTRQNTVTSASDGLPPNYADHLVLLNGARVDGPLLIWHSHTGRAQTFERDGTLWSIHAVERYVPIVEPAETSTPQPRC